MTTTELIKILQDNERGGISHKPRNISLSINGRYMPDPQISLSGTGDGICGPEIDLDIEGDWLEQQPCEDCISRKYIEPIVEELENICISGDEHILSLLSNIKNAPPVTPRKNLAETSQDCISREVVINHICENKECYKEDCKGRILKRCPDLQWVFDLPPVTPKRPKGKWVRVVDKAGHWVWECDCKWQQRFATNYCPNCGADMRGENNGNMD